MGFRRAVTVGDGSHRRARNVLAIFRSLISDDITGDSQCGVTGELVRSLENEAWRLGDELLVDTIAASTLNSEICGGYGEPTRR